MMSVITIAAASIFTYGFYTTPSFLFSICDKIEADTSIIRTIVENRGYTLAYSKSDLHEGDTATFYVAITGMCDSSYAKVRGYYFLKNNKYKYAIQDTTIVNKCHL
ncbi:hypothetical protein [Hymenobacter swuensis]|uniref:hypothetical protein n=1 Tax=Hymenobacter swuensis TaxID=1446467 RepID=UPI0012DDCDD6|nr:hypothetical protein [Hymenobacter swuensis]